MSDISLVAKSDLIQVHLTDGRTLQAPRGTTAGALFKVIAADLPAPETLTTPIPPRPGAVATAAMTSVHGRPIHPSYPQGRPSPALPGTSSRR
jgi:hypothetical protein